MPLARVVGTHPVTGHDLDMGWRAYCLSVRCDEDFGRFTGPICQSKDDAQTLLDSHEAAHESQRLNLRAAQAEWERRIRDPKAKDYERTIRDNRAH